MEIVSKMGNREFTLSFEEFERAYLNRTSLDPVEFDVRSPKSSTITKKATIRRPATYIGGGAR